MSCDSSLERFEATGARYFCSLFLISVAPEIRSKYWSWKRRTIADICLLSVWTFRYMTAQSQDSSVYSIKSLDSMRIRRQRFNRLRLWPVFVINGTKWQAVYRRYHWPMLRDVSVRTAHAIHTVHRHGSVQVHCCSSIPWGGNSLDPCIFQTPRANLSSIKKGLLSDLSTC